MLSSINDVALRQMMCCFATTMLHCVRKILFPKDKGVGKNRITFAFFCYKKCPVPELYFYAQTLGLFDQIHCMGEGDYEDKLIE